MSRKPSARLRTAKANRSRLRYPKAHWIDVACVGGSGTFGFDGVNRYQCARREATLRPAIMDGVPWEHRMDHDQNPRKLIVGDIANQVGRLEKGVADWRKEMLRTREAALVLLEALERLISKEPEDSPKRDVLVARAAIAQAKGVLLV